MAGREYHERAEMEWRRELASLVRALHCEKLEGSYQAQQVLADVQLQAGLAVGQNNVLLAAVEAGCRQEVQQVTEALRREAVACVERGSTSAQESIRVSE